MDAPRRIGGQSLRRCVPLTLIELLGDRLSPIEHERLSPIEHEHVAVWIILAGEARHFDQDRTEFLHESSL